jgi:AcrR family transcriptional regulator
VLVEPTVTMRRDARRNRQRLIAEAKRLFAERGIDAPLDELANRAEVGAGTLYRHFPSRDALVRALYDDGVAELHAYGPQILAARTAWESVERWLELLSGWLAERPYIPGIMRRMAEIEPDHRPGMEFQELMDGIVERAQEEGALRPDVTAVDLGILVDMLGSLGQYGGAYLPYWRRQLTVVIDGLRARPDATPLPGAALEFGDFHDMSHRKRPAD